VTLRLTAATFTTSGCRTTWQRQVDLLQSTVDALAPLDRALVVTTGPSFDPSEVTTNSNTIVVTELPHRRVLDRVDAVVTHAGHGTVLSRRSVRGRARCSCAERRIGRVSLGPVGTRRQIPTLGKRMSRG
jgi:hypothetical protein